jgi:glycosyltransferase involved in cell wall biosynthesis
MVDVSIVIPCRNEESTIALLLDAILRQTFPTKQMEVVIADGMSTDQTRLVIEAWKKQNPQLSVTVIDNPQRIIPAAINLAIAASKGSIIVRLDAHCVPQPDYITRSVDDLKAGLGENVGGLWLIKPGADSWQAESIAAAAAHPLAVGDARYRYSNQPGEVDTVPFGAFHRSLIVTVGGFDETLLTNEDYEFNTRIRLSGGRVWFDPNIQSTYFARATFAELAKQYWRYGYWKLQMLRRYPKTIRLRQALPPLFVIGLLGLLLLGLFWHPALWVGLAVLAFYLVVLFITAVSLAGKAQRTTLLIGIPIAITIMHFCWGAGFLWSLVSPPQKDR